MSALASSQSPALSVAFSAAWPLPWRERDADSRRVIGSQLVALGIVIVLGIVIPLIELPERLREVREVVAMTRITLAPAVPKPMPPPEPPRVLPLEVPADAPIAPQRVAQPPLPTQRQVAIATPTAVPPAAPRRDTAVDAGLAALDDAFADLRAPDARSLRATNTATSATQGPARADRAALGANQGRRAMALDASPGRVGDVALNGRTETRVAAPVAAAGAARGSSDARTQPGGRQRSLEEIWRVFDANKGRLFALYQSALVQAPGLAGKIVLELVIEPDGSVQRVRVVSSEIDQPALVEQVTQRVRGFRFEAKDVTRTTVTYPVHFLPG
jgi:TonB family protein